jgi:lysozyme family protein
MKLTVAMEQEYNNLYQTMIIKKERLTSVVNKVDFFKSIQPKYSDIELATGIPWWIVCLIHHMESGNDFRRHLHNGDPLTAKTVQVPKNRPLEGNPPFTFEESAIDALEYDRIDLVQKWDIATTLHLFEGFNGWGYRRYHPKVKTPYLWSFCSHYTKGKYVSDGKFDNNAVSQQIGIACLLKEMERQKMFEFDA